MQHNRSPYRLPTARPSWRLPLALGALGVVAMAACLQPGCSGSSSDTPLGQAQDPPIPTASYFVALSGPVPQSGDILGVRFNLPVTVEGPGVQGFVFQKVGDTLGSGAVLSQSAPGSDSVEITLGQNPVLTPGDPALAGVSRINVASAGAGVVQVVGTNGVRAAGKRFVVVEDRTDSGPVLVAASLVDSNQNGVLDRGDQIVVSFDQPITLPEGSTPEESFELPVAGDTFGTGAVLLRASTEPTNRVAVIRLGDDPVVNEVGEFDDAVTDPGSPSGLRVGPAPTVTDISATGPNPAEPGVTVDVTPRQTSQPGGGRAATNVVGAPDPFTSWLTSQGLDDPTGVDSHTGELIVESLLFDEDLLFVADRGNHRVLVFRGVPGSSFPAASWVLGQPDFATATTDDPFESEMPSPTASNMNAPGGVAFDAANNRLYVADTGYHRVLVFTSLFFVDPTSGALQIESGRAADFVIGQSSLVVGLPNRGQSSPSALTLFSPQGMSLSGNNLAVADTGNHRVLLYVTSPSSPQVLPSVALGQEGFNAGQPNRGGDADRNTLSSPTDVFVSQNFNVNGSSGAVLAADTGNQRVLIWRSTSPLLGGPADVVLGQPDGTTTDPGTSATALASPAGVVGDLATSRIYVADRDNSRVVTYDASGGIGDGEAGEAIGQATNDDGEPNRGGEPGPETLSFPGDVELAGTTLLVSDSGNHRVLGYPGDSLPETHQDAELVLGQPTLEVGTPNARRYYLPTDALLIDGRLVVSDTGNHRVLIYDSVPVSGDPDPDVVLGQLTLQATRANQGGAVSAATLNLPAHLATDGVGLAVADTGNHRVLIWMSAPDVTGTPADIILGQSTGDGSLPNAGGAAGAATLNGPQGVAAAPDSFLVADTGNHRVLIFDAMSTLAGFDNARVVLGQRSFLETASNRGEPVSGVTLRGPRDVFYGANRTYVADTDNHRVLVWRGVPAANGVSARGWYGQASLQSAAEQGPASSTLFLPSGLALDTGFDFLLVADTGNHRVLFFDDVGGESRAARSASGVLGQVDLFRGEPNQGGEAPTAATLKSPRGVFWNGYDTVVADSGNSRAALYR